MPGRTPSACASQASLVRGWLVAGAARGPNGAGGSRRAAPPARPPRPPTPAVGGQPVPDGGGKDGAPGHRRLVGHVAASLTNRSVLQNYSVLWEVISGSL